MARSRTALAIRIKFDGNFPQSQMAAFHKISPQIPCLPSLPSPWKPHIKTIPAAGRKARNKGKIKNRTMTTVELIKSIAFDFGWIVSTDEEEDTVVFDFCYYTKHGLDYGFCAELTGNKFDGFLREVERNCEDFDPDYEAYRWIGYDGHGKCGAPYHIKDIVDEMEEAKKISRIFITH